jgi:hypothetical protein
MGKIAACRNTGSTFRKCRRGDRQDVCLDGPTQLIRLKECLIELTPENLIACRNCRTIADISVNVSLFKLICPTCYQTLGSWASTPEAVADMRAFVANGGAGE